MTRTWQRMGLIATACILVGIVIWLGEAQVIGDDLRIVVLLAIIAGGTTVGIRIAQGTAQSTSSRRSRSRPATNAQHRP